MRYYAWMLSFVLVLSLSSCEDTPTEQFVVAWVYLRTDAPRYQSTDTVTSKILNQFADTVAIEALQCTNRISFGLDQYTDSSWTTIVPLTTDDCLTAIYPIITPKGRISASFPLSSVPGLSQGVFRLVTGFRFEHSTSMEDFVYSNSFEIRN
jgi:hypothetical protein